LSVFGSKLDKSWLLCQHLSFNKCVSSSKNIIFCFSLHICVFTLDAARCLFHWCP
jgi:hypothetical protein